MSPEEVLYASGWRRALASLLDNLVWLIFYSWFLGGVVGALAEESPEAAGLVVFVYLSAWFNYFTFSEWKWGQTIGKNATGIEVRDIGRSPKLTFGQASIRNLLRLVDFFVIGWVMIARTDRKQRLGDKAAKTVVLRTPPKTIPGTTAAPAAPAVRGAAAATAAPIPPPKPAKEERRLPQVPWSASDSVWGLIGGLILAVVVAPLLVLPFDPDLDSIGALLAAQALLGGSLLFVAVGMASGWKFSRLREALGRLGLQDFRFSGLGIALLTLLVYYIAVAIFAAFVLEPKQDDIGGELGIGDESVLVAIAAVVLIAVLAPISEELFFRGFVFGGLRGKYSLWPAALIAGGIFGLIHAPTGITTVVPLAALGIALCWLYDRTGSLWPCVFAHVVNNALALAVTA